ncbi:MAG: substrate-binding domain-containing protein [Bacteroidetes bacterium]|nr:substrate-binding domain-containing protein [Bacteroidota bacterium]
MKTTIISRLTGFFIICGLLLFSGCGGGPSNSKSMDTPTTGTIKIGIDDSYSLLLDAELFTFHSLYPNSQIDTLCRNEVDIINSFLRDSIPLMVISRKLTRDEESQLNSAQIFPKTTKIAYDAIAFIMNRENPDTALFFDQVKSIFEGRIKSWKEIAPKSKLGDLKIVFDNYKSCNTRYLREKFNLQKLPDVCFAVQNNAEVINFVEKNKGAIGIVSVNWVSDKSDTVSHSFLKRVVVAGISAPGSKDPNGAFFTPHPGYIAEGVYPFTREVYCINRQAYMGLAYGFSSFIAGEKGQLIVLHTGMVPAAMPVRLVEIKH